MKYPPLVLAAALLAGCPSPPHADPVDRGSIAFDGDALVATVYTAAGDQLVRFRPDDPVEKTVIAGNGADGASASAPFSVHLAAELGSACIGMRLFLPEAWANDGARRRTVGVPVEIER